MIFPIKDDMKFHGRIIEGKMVFEFYQSELRQKYLKKLKEGQMVVETIKSDCPAKTLEQLGYYYAVILPIVTQQLIEDGHECFGVPINEDMTDDVLKNFCARFDGKIINKADMNIQQASIFITNCINWANRALGCQIPEPTKG